jgi:hypothetical protein
LITLGAAGVAQDYRRVVKGFWAYDMQTNGFQVSGFSYEKPAFTLFPYFYNYIQFFRTEPRPGMPPGEIVFKERVAKRFGFFHVLAHMSFVYALNDQPDNAEKTMLTIRKLHPSRYPEVYRDWKKNSTAMPEKFAKVFMRLPVPDSPGRK